MEVLYIGLNRPETHPPTILITMVFPIMEDLESLGVREDVDLCIRRPGTLLLPIMEFTIIGIKVMMTEEVDLGLKIPLTPTLVILDQVLMVMGEMDIGLRTATLSTINQVVMVDYWVSLLILVLFKKAFMVMREVI